MQTQVPGAGPCAALHTARNERVHALSHPSPSDRGHHLFQRLRLREAPRSRPQALRGNAEGAAHSLESGAVQGQGRQGGVGEAAAAGQAERLQPRAAPAQLHHAVVRDALRAKRRVRPDTGAEPPAADRGATRAVTFHPMV